jgi:poly(A) polymerase/tRNA nucleotidyltransferase (CCA-adding enzyme)
VTAAAVVAPAFLSDPALIAVLDALPEARIIGGAVRDALVDGPTADIDLATPRPPDDVARALAAAKLRAVPTGIDHGTVTAISGNRGFEITTLRRDVETDGRHAVVEFTDDWRADASRRDFTINAMSMTRDGRVFDYFGGIADLRGGGVRFVGDPAVRIAEDYLRILRYFRFYARYGRRPPDAATQAALAGGAASLTRLSPERVWSEIKRILLAPDPDASLALMQRLGILHAVLSEVAALRPVAFLPPDPIVRLAALRPASVEALADRLRLAGAERERLSALMHPALAETATDDDLRRALDETPADILVDRIHVHGGPPQLIARIKAMPRPEFPLGGKHLQEAGVAPGPRMGQLLRDLRSFWRDNGCTADDAALRRELARRLALR